MSFVKNDSHSIGEVNLSKISTSEADLELPVRCLHYLSRFLKTHCNNNSRITSVLRQKVLCNFFFHKRAESLFDNHNI
jgi:hypothetical protein